MYRAKQQKIVQLVSELGKNTILLKEVVDNVMEQVRKAIGINRFLEMKR